MKASWPTSLPTASPSWTSRSGRRGRTSCWRSSRPSWESSSNCTSLSPLFPFTTEQIDRVARTEPTLRDMLQQFRHLFDHVVYGSSETDKETRRQGDKETATPRMEELPPGVKSVIVIKAPAVSPDPV